MDYILAFSSGQEVEPFSLIIAIFFVGLLLSKHVMTWLPIVNLDNRSISMMLRAGVIQWVSILFIAIVQYFLGVSYYGSKADAIFTVLPIACFSLSHFFMLPNSISNITAKDIDEVIKQFDSKRMHLYVVNIIYLFWCIIKDFVYYYRGDSVEDLEIKVVIRAIIILTIISGLIFKDKDWVHRAAEITYLLGVSAFCFFYAWS